MIGTIAGLCKEVEEVSSVKIADLCGERDVVVVSNATTQELCVVPVGESIGMIAALCAGLAVVNNASRDLDVVTGTTRWHSTG
jgi:hypothetical protein